jgi:hypothetical protein
MSFMEIESINTYLGCKARNKKLVKTKQAGNSHQIGDFPE